MKGTKEKDCELLIAEKPASAKRIAEVLSDGEIIKNLVNFNAYLQLIIMH